MLVKTTVQLLIIEVVNLARQLVFILSIVQSKSIFDCFDIAKSTSV